MSDDVPRILHLIAEADWEAAQSSGAIAPASLEEEGFVHCCTDVQLLGVVERFYAGRTDLLALEIVPALLGVELRWEAPSHPDGSTNTAAEAAQLFPHVYGPIPSTAVAAAHRLT